MRPYSVLLASLPVVVLGALAAACAPRAFTPSARPMPLSPAQAPKVGETDLQLDGTANGEPLGPGISGGNLRYRRGLTEQLAITGDTGVIRADGDAGDMNPYAGTGRVGVQIHGDATDELVGTAFIGTGGGYAPEAGGWVSADVGAGLSGTHRYVRPTFLITAYGSQPFATETFIVADTMLRLPRTLGVQWILGMELGQIDRAVVLGLSMAVLFASENDQQEALTKMFLGIGAGFRFGAI